MAALCLLIGSFWVGTKITTDYLLYKDATSTAHNWARLLVETVTDLEQIAGGEKPTKASMTFLSGRRRPARFFDTKSIIAMAIRSWCQTTE